MEQRHRNKEPWTDGWICPHGEAYAVVRLNDEEIIRVYPRSGVPASTLAREIREFLNGKTTQIHTG